MILGYPRNGVLRVERVRDRVTAIRRGFELYECPLVTILMHMHIYISHQANTRRMATANKTCVSGKN